MKRLVQGICLIAAFSCVIQSVQAQSVWHTDLDTARREAEKLNRPILCHFGAKWCAPCQKMERTVLNESHVVNQLRALVVCLKVDVDKHPELAQRFGVDRFPTDVLLEPNGKRLMANTGYQPAREYLTMVNRAARRYSDLVASRTPKTSPPVSSMPDQGQDASQLVTSTPPMLMLDGYCPVTLQTERQWIRGKPEFETEFKGQRYQFVSQTALEAFRREPEQYVPQMLGCDPVIVWSTDRAVPGSIEWGAYYDNRLYLFTSEENRRQFKESPDKYITTQVVLDVSQIETILR